MLDLLVFGDPGSAPLADALAGGGARWLATRAMRDELARVLGYPAIADRLARLGGDAQRVLARFDAYVEPLRESAPRAACVCSDPDDQVFVDLAVATRACLLSKDRAVLSMRKRLAAHGVDVRAAWMIPASDVSMPA